MRTQLRRLATLGSATALLLALALLAADRHRLGGIQRQRLGVTRCRSTALYRTLLMLAGTGSPLVAARSVGRGRARRSRGCVRRDRDLAWYLATRRRHRTRRRRVERCRMDLPSARARALPDTGAAVRAAVHGRGDRTVARATAASGCARLAGGDADHRLFAGGPDSARNGIIRTSSGDTCATSSTTTRRTIPTCSRCRPIRIPAFYAELGKRPAGKRDADRGAVAARIALQRAVALPGCTPSADPDRTGDARCAACTTSASIRKSVPE